VGRGLVLLFAALLVPGLPALADEAAQVAPQDELGEVALLKTRGGHLSVARLRALLERGTPQVRLAALDALAHVGLRSAAAGRAVRLALETTDVAERKAALRALGRIGDGRDLEAFLGALRDEDAGLRTAALQGLRDLTGRRLPVSPTRCSLWWRSSAKGLRQAVRAALDAVPRATDRHADAARGTLSREGWVELDAVTESAREWLRATDHEIRAAGFHVAATLRIADLASDVESALPFVSQADAAAGHAAAEVLGLPPELLPPVWQRRLREQAEIAR
jgi:hypothetical protein